MQYAAAMRQKNKIILSPAFHVEIDENFFEANACYRSTETDRVNATVDKF